jgi:hypothetical protein
MKTKRKEFGQHLYHDIDNEEEAEAYLESLLPLIGDIVVFFNGLEQSLDSSICELFSDRHDSTGMIVLHKMNYSAKIDLFKRMNDDFQISIGSKIEIYETLIGNLKESGRLRNLVVHADWENTDNDGYTYVNFKISKNGMHQEYVQFSDDSLKKIVRLIWDSRIQLSNYWKKREELMQSY